MSAKIEIKRVYDEPQADDGRRLLVDRLWPRGLSKEKARVDLWLKDIAPGEELRHWFGHDPDRWAEFRERYRRELELNPEALKELREIMAKEKTVTLLYAATDRERNNAVALRDVIALEEVSPNEEAAGRQGEAMRKLTREELRQHGGGNGLPVYIAYDGLVYDVSESYEWEMGEHQGAHEAGHDLTDEMGDAPHEPDVLERFPVVGELED